MRKRKIIEEPSRFFCTKCAREGVPIIRTAGQMREAGHLKRLYCLNCGETNHVEIRPYGKYQYKDFLLEFKGGNFKDGQRVLPYKQFKNTLVKKGKLDELQKEIEEQILKERSDRFD